MSALSWPTATVPRLRLAGEFPLADRGFETRYLGPAHALHVHGYAGRMRLAGEAVELRPGDLTLSPAGQPSAYDLAEPGRHWCVHFYPASPDAEVMDLPLHLHLGSASGYAAEKLSAISRLHNRGLADPLARAASAVALQDLLIWCAGRGRGDADPAADAAQLADRVAAIIEVRFAEPLNADRIAREVGAPQHAVARAFRQRFGMTVPRYALQRRMAHARYLLESTDLPIAAVGERVGVSDPHYFNKLVRRFLGANPTDVRNGGG
jgi:AraC-like DNA-binding protein